MPTKRKAPKAARRKTAPKTKKSKKTSSKAAKKSPSAKRTSASKKTTKTSAGKKRTKAAPPTSRKTTARTSDPQAAYLRASSTPRTIFDILHPGAAAGSDPNFRDAPDGWTQDHARTQAATAGLELAEDHWEVIRVLQGCYKDELQPRIRLLRDALEARFASKGGMKYLFAILPGGPIAQGCTLAGVKPPHGAKDLSFGSVA